jgi:hypothetical protein
MRRHIGELARAIAARGDDLAVAHQDGADRNLAARTRRFGCGERLIHEACRAAAHLASPRPV